jgi:hypothetical protein
MKTAMQEMINWIEERFNNPKETEVFKKATQLLEKEKEQLEISFDLGRDEVTSAFIIDGEDYYNKKYNQKKY